MDKIVGIFEGNQAGFGFVRVEGEDDDIFIPEKHAALAMHKDTVEVTIKKGSAKGKRREGKIVNVIKHETTNVVGTFSRAKSFGFVIPDNKKFSKDIYIAGKNIKGAKDGQKVMAQITKYADKHHKPEGKIIEIIGNIDDPGTDVKSVVLAYEIPVDFSEEVLAETESINTLVTDKEKQGKT